MEFAHLRAFLAVVDAGSLTEAAAATGGSRVTLGRRVTALEARLGQTLLVRGEGGVTPTSAGLALHREGRALLGDYLAALDALGARLPTEITVSAVAELLPVLASRLVPRWLGPGGFRLAEESEPLGSSGPGRLAAVAQSSAPRGFEGVLRLGALEQILAASEAYVARHGVPVSLGELGDHRVLFAQGAPSWPARGGGRVSVRATSVLPSQADVLLAVRAGLGLGVVQREPGLVPVLGDAIGATAPIWLVGSPEDVGRFEVGADEQGR